MPGAAFLRGDRVTLRTVESEDVDLFQRARNDPEYREGLLFTTPKNRETVAEFVEEVVADDGADASVNLLVCADGEPVGGVALFDRNADHATLAYWLAPEARGQGYATEAVSLVLDYAFDTLGINHVVAWTVDYNDASRALLERLGFEHEGTYREHVWRKGEYRDTVHYGLLRREWNEVRETAPADSA